MQSEPVGGANGDCFVLGVEGGGTKTIACLARITPDEEPEILGRGLAGPSNLQAIGLDRTFANLQAAIHEARSQARLKIPLDAACLAMAGIDRPQEQALLDQWARSHAIARRVSVVNDSVGLLAAGTENGWGVALVSGTGSIAFGQTVNGESERTGGWGYLLGDEGSAYSVALAGLRAAVRSADGREPPNELLPAFLNRLELEHANDLLESIYQSGRDRAWIASLADVVTAVADFGDSVAQDIIQDAADELAWLVIATARKLGLDGEPVPFCFTGGLILNSPKMQAKVASRVAGEGLRLVGLVPVEEPVWGVIKLAGQLLKPSM